MSYKTWINYGYGICVSDIADIPVERLRQLLEKAPMFCKKVDEWLAQNGIEHPAYDDYMSFDDEYMLGLATILSRVIEEVEQIHLTACDDYNGDDYLIYMPSYPWELSENELTLTEEQIEQVLSKYVSVLTDEAITIEYQSAENGG